MPFIDKETARANFEAIFSDVLTRLDRHPATSAQTLAAAAEYLNQLHHGRMEIRGLPRFEQDQIDQKTLKAIIDEDDMITGIFKRNPRLNATTFYERLYNLPDVNPITIIEITSKVSIETRRSLNPANKLAPRTDLSQLTQPSTIFDGTEPQTTDEATELLKKMGLFGNRPKKYGKRKNR